MGIYRESECDTGISVISQMVNEIQSESLFPEPLVSSSPGRLLIVDDDGEFLSPLCEFLSAAGYEVAGHLSGQEALEDMNERHFDLLLTDLIMPEMDGIALLLAAKERDPQLVSIVITGQGSVQSAVDAMKIGAFDFLVKPLEFKMLDRVIARAMGVRRLRQENQGLQEAVEVYRLKRELRDSDERYNSLFENMIEGLAYCKMLFEDGQPRDFIYLGVNAAFEKLTGLKNVIGKRVTEVIPGIQETDSEIFEIYGRVAMTGKPEKFEMFIEALKMWFSISVYSSKKEFFVAVFDVITERKMTEQLLQESEAKFRDMAEQSIVGIYLIQDKLFRYVNPKLAHIFGYAVEEIIDQKGPEDLVPPQDWPVVRENVRRRISGEIDSAHYIFKGVKKNKEIIHVDVYGSRTTYKARPAVIGTLLDITGRRMAEEKIQRQLHKLSALRAIDLAISSSVDIRITLNIFIGHAITQLAVDAANVLLLNPHSQILQYAVSQGFQTNALRHTHLRLGEGYAGVAALENRIVRVPNLNEEGTVFKLRRLLEGEDFVSYYGVPLVAKGQVKGVLEIFHRSPMNPDEEWFEFLDSLALQGAIAIDNNSLFQELQKTNLELSLAYDSTIEGWSHALDYRDKETEGHSRRVTELTLMIARDFGMSEAELVCVRRGALLHDIGKMGIPDSILLKPGPLTDEEWEVMRKHPLYSYELLHPIAHLRPSLDIPYCHHEKWDGTGYPRGLRGEQIPLSARIFAVVDVWDALSSDRPYRPAWTEDKVRELIISKAGTHFDPRVVDAFLKMKLRG